MIQILVIARLTFHEAIRSKILLAAAVLGMLFLIVFGLGFNFIQREMDTQFQESGGLNLLQMNEIRNFLLMSGLYVVNFLSVMMAVLTSVNTLSGEIASGTIQTLVAKPIKRFQILIGKWVGYVVMLSLYLLFMAGGVMLVVFLFSGYTAPNAFRGLLFLWLNTLLMLSVSICGGAWLSTLANGVLVFGLFGIAFVGGWIEQIGSVLGNQTAVHIGVICSLVMPSEALWKRAAFEMQSPMVAAFGGVSPFTTSSVPSPLMIGYAILYTFFALNLAIQIFGRRDL